MTTNEPDGNERIDSRAERALTQYLTVLADVGQATGADDLYLVVSQSGNEYLVDTREGRCECDDHHYWGVRCKHLRRVAFATGDETIPASVDGVDPQLGEHTDETPRRQPQNIEVTLEPETDADGETLQKWSECIEDRCPVSESVRNATDVVPDIEEE